MVLRILIAPSGLKVSLEADDVADRIQVGGLRVVPGVEITKAPTRPTTIATWMPNQTVTTIGLEIGRSKPLFGSQEA